MWFDTKSVFLTDGVARGGTNINAFDNALRAARIADFNLIRVTSIVPPNTPVRQLGRAGAPISGLGKMLPTVYETMQSNAPGEVLCAGIGIGCPENESSPAAGVIFSHSENCSREEMIKMLRSMVDEGMDQMRMIKHYRFEYAISATVVDSNTPTAVFAAVCFCDSDLEQMFLL